MKQTKVFSGLRLDDEMTAGLEKASVKLGGRAGKMPTRQIIRMYIREGLQRDGIISKSKGRVNREAEK